jgi:hypothetical protein
VIAQTRTCNAIGLQCNFLYFLHLLALSTADNKHVGVLVLKKGTMTQPATVTWSGGLLVGTSHSDVCDICRTRRGLDLTGADSGECLGFKTLTLKEFTFRSDLHAFLSGVLCISSAAELVLATSEWHVQGVAPWDD